MSVPSSGKKITFSGISIHKIANYKAVESWDNFYALGMMQQMGAISLPVKK